MNAEHLLDAMGLLDDGLIREAEDYAVPRRRTNYGHWIAWAASFAVVLVLGYGVTHLGMGGGGSNGSGAVLGAAGAGSMVTDEGQEPASPPAEAGGSTANGGLPSDLAPDVSDAPEVTEDVPGEDSSGSQGTPPAGSDNSVKDYDYCAAIMVDGVLYWSTDIPVSGEVDESTIRTVTGYTSTVPEMDGQTNFSQDLSAKYAMTADGLVVRIDGEWVLFDATPPWERYGQK